MWKIITFNKSKENKYKSFVKTALQQLIIYSSVELFELFS